MITLNVNIDHVATVRNARGGLEPDPVSAAIQAEVAGASGIVCHLREDRRHVHDKDLRRLREVITGKLDLEMAANDEIIIIALDVKPDMVTIVPEKRMELTTEGGLDVLADLNKLTELVKKMHDKDIEVSFFIEPDFNQIDAVLKTGGDFIEMHTGTYGNLRGDKAIKAELNKLKSAAEYAHKNHLKIAAGHGLNYLNTQPIAQMPFINELSIGHSIISRAIYIGLGNAVKEMVQLINTSSVSGYLQKIASE